MEPDDVGKGVSELWNVLEIDTETHEVGLGLMFTDQWAYFLKVHHIYI